MDNIIVKKYKYSLEEVTDPLNAHLNLVQVDLLTNISSATATVNDFGDPEVMVMVSITDKNLQSLIVGNILSVKRQANRPLEDFTIYNVKVDTKMNTIVVLAEPIFNESRNGTVVCLPNNPEDNKMCRLNKLWNVGDISASRQYDQLQLAPLIAYVHGYNINDPEAPGYLTHYHLSSYRLGPDNPMSSGSRNLSVDKKSFLNCIGGSEGSFLDQLHGEMIKQNFSITHYKELGNPKRNFVLSTEHQVTGISIITDISEIINGVVHVFDYENSIISTPARIIATDNLPINGSKTAKVTPIAVQEYRSGRVLVKDWGESADLFSDPNEVGIPAVRRELDVQARQWNNSNKNLGLPKVTINVDFNDLEYFNDDESLKEFSRLFILNLGDSVTIYHAQLKTYITGRVSGFEFDILAERYVKMTIGNAQSDILDRIK